MGHAVHRQPVHGGELGRFPEHAEAGQLRGARVDRGRIAGLYGSGIAFGRARARRRSGRSWHWAGVYVRDALGRAAPRETFVSGADQRGVPSRNAPRERGSRFEHGSVDRVTNWVVRQRAGAADARSTLAELARSGATRSRRGSRPDRPSADRQGSRPTPPRGDAGQTILRLTAGE